jgi:16S rRNA C967 or C1407 C5-methylase (RsmB/RsmF family)
MSFLQENELSATFYESLLSLSHVPSRFVHPVNRSLRSGRPVARATKEDITRELGVPLHEIHDVDWLPAPNLEFWRVPGHYRVHSPSFKSGAFQALDAGSGVAVHALEVEPDDNVLDLCFAPGGKGALCGEATRAGRGTVTAVDASEQRLAIAMARSRRSGNNAQTRYHLTDGTTFDVGAPRINAHLRAKCFETTVEAERAIDTALDARWADWQRDPTRLGANGAGPRGKWHVSTNFQPMQADDVFVPYDKVLVDAECTHDGAHGPPASASATSILTATVSLAPGSVSHILKYIRPMSFSDSRPASPAADDVPVVERSTSPPPLPTALNFPQAFLDSLAESRTSLPELQLGLLRNGFRLLRPGGVLVYATCSRAVDQGERLVERFLKEINGDDGERCAVEDVPARERMPCAPRDERYLRGRGLRFSGEYTPGREDEWVSALFVCRLRKIR